MSAWRRRTLALCLTLVSCGGSVSADPVPLQAASTHFRYYATRWLRQINGVRSAAEANRADVYTYFGLNDEEVVDYFLLDADQIAAHCTDERYCTVDRQIFTQDELDHHNLIHAYLSGVGEPPRPIREGVAEGLDCYREPYRSYEPGLPTWQDLFRGDQANSPAFYISAMRLVRHLLLRFGPARFLAYYRSAADTADPATFAGDFQAFWSIPIDDAWTAANAAGDVVPLPLCACRAPAMVPDAPGRWVVERSYAPLAAPPGALLTLSLPYSAPDEHTLIDCDRAQANVPVAADYGAGINLIQLDAAPHYLLNEAGGGAAPVLTAGAPLSHDCAAAGTLALTYDVQRIGIVVPRGSPPMYVRVTAPEAQVLTSAHQNLGVGFRLCSDCSLSDCAPIPATPEFQTLPPAVGVALPAAGAILEVDSSQLSGPGLVSVVAKLDFP